MKIQTTNFGSLEISKENIITFINGILGFKEYKEYIIINDEEEDSPFCWLQSVEEPTLAFALVNPYLIHDSYNPKLPSAQVEKLGDVDSEQDYSVLSIMTIPDEVEKMSANLMAPLLINLKTKKAMQIISEGDKYPVKYFLFDKIKKQEAK